MPAPTITALPTPPARSDAPDVFVTRADAFLGALPGFGTQANALADYFDQQVQTVEDLVASAGYSGTSTSTVTIGLGSKSLTTQAGLSYLPGAYVLVADSAAPNVNFMAGSVLTYDETTGAMQVDVTRVGGSGEQSSWTVTLSGPPGSDATVVFATAAEVRAGNATGKAVDPAALVDADGYVAVTANGAFTLDFSAGRKFKVTLTANSTMTIIGLTKEISGVIRFQQDATGGRTLGLNAAIKKVGPYTLSVSANAVDRCGVEICNGVAELTALEKGIA